MIFGYFILFISVMISAIAAWYSVVGLTAIFAAKNANKNAVANMTWIEQR